MPLPKEALEPVSAQIALVHLGPDPRCLLMGSAFPGVGESLTLVTDQAMEPTRALFSLSVRDLGILQMYSYVCVAGEGLMVGPG